jgi:pilus assembly protein CpaB
MRVPFRPLARRRPGSRLPGRHSPWPRRVLALALLALAALVAGRSPRATPTAAPHARLTPVVLAAHDLPAGHVLTPADLTPASWPVGQAPAGSRLPVASLTGKALAGAVRRGEPLTDVRVVGQALARAAGGPGARAVPVRVSDPGVVRLLRAGDRIDLLAAAPGERHQAAAVATDIRIIAIFGSERSDPDGSLVLVVASPESARRIAGISPDDRITVILRSA